MGHGRHKNYEKITDAKMEEVTKRITDMNREKNEQQEEEINGKIKGIKGIFECKKNKKLTRRDPEKENDEGEKKYKNENQNRKGTIRMKVCRRSRTIQFIPTWLGEI